MRKLQFKITILSYWHAGTGESRGAQVDAVVCRDREDLPYLPGKTVKGLLREGVQQLEDFNGIPGGSTEQLFGKQPREGENTGSIPGQLFFEDASLASGLKAQMDRNKELKAGFFDTFSSTKIDRETGVAERKTLRSVELVVPLTLWTEVQGPATENWVEILEQGAKLVRGLGSHRHRGLGRCRWEVTNA